MRINETCVIWAQTQASMDKGVFGAPTFFVGQEMFWGDGRLEDALAFALRGSPGWGHPDHGPHHQKNTAAAQYPARA